MPTTTTNVSKNTICLVELLMLKPNYGTGLALELQSVMERSLFPGSIMGVRKLL
jgi:hypothetical protein